MTGMTISQAEDLEERVARAIADANHSGPWHLIRSDEQDGFLSDARAAIAAIHDQDGLREALEEASAYFKREASDNFVPVAEVRRVRKIVDAALSKGDDRR